MKTIKANILTEIVNGNWWDLKHFFDKLLQPKFLESLMKTKKESSGNYKIRTIA